MGRCAMLVVRRDPGRRQHSSAQRAIPQFALDLAPDARMFAWQRSRSLSRRESSFGLAPALSASRWDINRELKSGGFLRQSLVGVQIAVCMILLIAAGLMGRALNRAQNIDPGFEMKNVTTISFNLAPHGYTLPGERAAFPASQMMERVSSIPGVNAVAQTAVTPLSDSHNFEQFKLPSQADSEMTIEVNYISPGYFTLLNIPIVRGRNFTLGEGSAGAAVIIPTESAARRLWPGQDPIGRVIEDDKTQYQVIGVARDTQVSHLGRSDETYLYLPAGPKQQLKEALIGACNESNLEPTPRGPSCRRSQPRRGDRAARRQSRMVAHAVAAGGDSGRSHWGALALVLAAIGVYGVVSYGVSRRIREIGIRMALGAEASVVHKLILKQAMRPVLIGAFIGIAGCAAVSRILSSMLFGLSSYDPVAFTVVPAFLIAIALAASYIPARRATRIDPMAALRQ